jgi:hypothetical protein
VKLGEPGDSARKLLCRLLHVRKVERVALLRLVGRRLAPAPVGATTGPRQVGVSIGRSTSPPARATLSFMELVADRLQGVVRCTP